MKQCPACSKLIKDKSEALCIICGWEFKFSRTGASLPIDQAQQQQLNIIKNNRKALAVLIKQVKTLSEQKEELVNTINELKKTLTPISVINVVNPTPNQVDIDDNSTENVDPKDNLPVESRTHKTPDHLLRSNFETYEEFTLRLEKLGALEIGSVRALKKKYDTNTKKLPLRILLADWAKDLDGIPRSGVEFFITADDKLVNKLSDAGAKHLLFIHFWPAEDHAVVKELEMHVSDNVIPIKMSWVEPITQMEYVWVPAGRFMMGSPEREKGRYGNEGPLHEVYLKGFWMGKFPVTQEEWVKVMQKNNSNFKLGNRYPVEKVSWKDAQDYIQKLIELSENKYLFRLPTEAEWEYACRAGTVSPFYFGDAPNPDLANFGGLKGCTTPVGSFQPNDFGLFDMHGNVWEWCADTYRDQAYDRHSKYNPIITGSGSNRAIRGGCWYRGPEQMRSAYRYGYSIDLRSSTLGFRLVRE